MSSRVRILTLFVLAACGEVAATSDARPSGDGGGDVDAIGGPCTANTTTCTNNQLNVCGPAGTVVSSEACGLGCATSGDRCTNVDPSNGLATEFDAATSGPDAVFATSTSLLTFNADTGDVTYESAPYTVPSVVHSQGAGLPPIRVFQFKSLAIRTAAKITGNNAVAFVSQGDVEIAARVELAGRSTVSGPGAITAVSPCQGTNVTVLLDSSNNNPRVAGAGGAGLGTNGAAGGNAAKSGYTTAFGGAGGTAAGSVNLEPLRGGCRGGNVISPTDAYWVNTGGGGGGAFQISSKTKITIAAAGVVDAGGGGAPFGKSGAGGGAGGALLLEAPTVVVDGTLAANGGGGSCFNDNGEDGKTAYVNGNLAALGANTCNAANGVGNGGNGGTKDAGPTVGTSVSTTTPVPVGGGGGGAAGRVRINTTTGGLTKGSASLISPAPSESAIKTR